MGGPGDYGPTTDCVPEIAPFCAEGAVWVYTRDNSSNWTQQAKLVGSGEVNIGGYGYGQGRSVALSGDGNTALVGGFDDNNVLGAVWVFTRDSSGNWTQQGDKLVGTGAVGPLVGQGSSVALSGDGNTALAGGFYDNNHFGSGVGLYPADDSYWDVGSWLVTGPTTGDFTPKWDSPNCRPTRQQR